jgi:predicted enzyme related to lactoylglutathione lyase
MSSNERPTRGNGKICYLEIPSLDIAVSVSFYKNVFGWNIREHGNGHFSFDDGVGEVSGMWATGTKPHSDPGIVVSIMVDSADATIEAIKENGGKIVRELGFQAPEITAHFSDPAGNILGIYQEPV